MSPDDIQPVAVRCISDTEDVTVDLIPMPDIKPGVVTDRVGGIIADNANDVLYVVAIADSGTDFDSQWAVHAFDIKNGNAFLRSSAAFDGIGVLPVLNPAKAVLYVIQEYSTLPTVPPVSTLVSIDLTTLEIMNSVSLPNESGGVRATVHARSEFGVHRGSEGSVGLVMTQNGECDFYIVDDPELP